MALARALDERAWILNRSGRVHFVISAQGHEGAEAGICAALTPGRDWLLPYYRSMAAMLSFGMTARELMLQQFGRADDPGSGGRQMPAHYGGAAYRIFSSSSPVGTQALHAAGIALAAKLRGESQVAAVMMGEGASNQGDVHEALNFAGIHRLPMILIVENNGYAISVPAEKQVAVRDVAVRASGYNMPGVIVDGTDVLGCFLAMRDAVTRALAGEGPTLIEAKVTRLTGHSSDDQQTKYRTEDDLAEGRGHDPLPAFRDELRAAGPPGRGLRRGDHGRGQRAGGRCDRFRRCRRRSGPRHADAPCLRGAGRRRAAAPAARTRWRLMAVRTFIEAIREGLRDEMRRDAAIIVLGEDVGKKGGVFFATDGLWAEFGDDRVIDTPLTESMIAGVSIGAAANGLRPVAEIQFADFIFPAMNQIIQEAARIRYRSNGTFGCPITIRAPFGAGVHGALYHSQSVEAFFAHVPGPEGRHPFHAVRREGLAAIRDP